MKAKYLAILFGLISILSLTTAESRQPYSAQESEQGQSAAGLIKKSLEEKGIKIPFVFIRNVGPLEPPHGGVVEEVRINVPLDDALFLPPEHNK
jgi:hypothetical protein